MRAMAALGLLVLVAGCYEVEQDTGLDDPIRYCPPGLFDEDANVFNDPSDPGSHQNAGQFYDRDLQSGNEGPGITPSFGYRDTGVQDDLFFGCEPFVVAPD